MSACREQQLAKVVRASSKQEGQAFPQGHEDWTGAANRRGTYFLSSLKPLCHAKHGVVTTFSEIFRGEWLFFRMLLVYF